MLLATYTLALAVWVAWIYVHYRYGDRPTTVTWAALMLGLGVFEYSKAAFSLAAGLPTLPLAFGVALMATGGVYVAHQRAEWGAGESEPVEEAGAAA